MTLDGITISAIVEELQDKITDGKIQKINQINDSLIILTIYNKETYKLLISIDSSNPRIHFTTKSFQNPTRPPNFCMVLRKHLQGFRIINIEQNKLDRTIIFTIDSFNELGIKSEKKLILDIMGKHSNLVLINEENKVIDAIKRISHDMSRVRAVYPGSSFDLIGSGKIDIDQETVDLSQLDIEDKTQIFRIFYSNFTGFSPLIGHEIAYKANLDSRRPFGSLDEKELQALNASFNKIRTTIVNKNFSPLAYLDEKTDRLIDYYCFELDHLAGLKQYDDSISNIIDNFYLENLHDDSLGQAKNALKDKIDHLLQKDIKKLDLMEKDLVKSKDYDQYRIEGDLLSSSVHLLKKGMDQVEVYNYYSNENLIIDLESHKSPWENVEKKYKKGKKLHRTNKILQDKIPLVKGEILYLDSILNSIDLVSNTSELEEIKDELIKGDYIKKTRSKKKKKVQEKSEPYKFITDNKLIIYVGKNNQQNEQITLKEANKDDYFFHVKDLPGSHVILKNNQNILEEEDILAAAYLAAKHSKASNDLNVDVDYTEKKNVYKEKGAKPGMVYYNNFITLRVDLENKPKNIRQLAD